MIRLKESQRRPLLRVLALLRDGERIAADGARRQAELAHEPKLQRFFRSQARQESVHAAVFDTAMSLLGRRRDRPSIQQPGLTKFARILLNDLARGDLLASVVGMQIVLEGLGRAVLEELDVNMSATGWGLHRLRHVLLGQEEAHHAFGIRYMKDEATRVGQDAVSGAVSMPEYLLLAREQLDDCAEICAALNVDAEGVKARFEHSLPDSMRSTPA